MARALVAHGGKGPRYVSRPTHSSHLEPDDPRRPGHWWVRLVRVGGALGSVLNLLVLEMSSLPGRKAARTPFDLVYVLLELSLHGNGRADGGLAAGDLVAGQMQVVVLDRERLPVVHFLDRVVQVAWLADPDTVGSVELVARSPPSSAYGGGVVIRACVLSQ